MDTREFTFKRLFSDDIHYDGKQIKLNEIKIPIIQRDYAQGRKSVEVDKIRIKFLDALHKAIAKNEIITLDFVYGDISEEKDGYTLTPLDGQQRLTTLFLLHWYSAKKERVDPDVCDFLKRFTYATRFSSRDFCEALVKYAPDFAAATLSDDIIDQPWYMYEWKNDPTIESMLVMIDAIQEKFKNQQGIWDSLTVYESIRLYFLPISDMGLTDELYIKMNSRGKPLTPFEHFKAEFGELLKRHNEEMSKKILHNFDVKWANMLFRYCGENSIVDDEFMRFFHFISDMLSYKREKALLQDEFDYDYAEKLYGPSNENAGSNIEYFVKSFDCWFDLDIKKFFKRYFSNSYSDSSKAAIYQDELNIFKECCDSYGTYYGNNNRKFTLGKTLLLYSVMTYLQNKDTISEDEFVRRIRIMRNLIQSSSNEIRENRMSRLLDEADSVILSGSIPASAQDSSGFNLMQKDEERRKTEWLAQNAELKDSLYRLEDHDLLKGCVSVVGLDNPGNFLKFELLFDRCGKDLVSRALLSIDDYSQFIKWRLQVGSAIRKSSWENLFHPTE